MHFFEKLFGRLRTVCRRNLAFHNKLRHGTKQVYFYIYIYIYFLAATIVSHSKQRLTACLIFMLSYHCIYRQFLQDRWYNFLSLIIISNSRSNVLKLTNENNNGSITCLSMLSANATNASDGLRYWGSLCHTDSENDTVTQTGDLDVHSRLLFARLQPPEILHTYAMIQPYNSDPHKRGV